MFTLQGAKGFYDQLLILALLFWILIRRSNTANLVRNLVQAFFGHSLKNSRWKKLKLKLKKLKTEEFLALNSKFWQFFGNLRRFSTKYYSFYLKSGKIVQKLKNLPKTQGKISKNLKFPANPLSSKAGKTSKKSLF